jgi:hypothetical protein
MDLRFASLKYYVLLGSCTDARKKNNFLLQRAQMPPLSYPKDTRMQRDGYEYFEIRLGSVASFLSSADSPLVIYFVNKASGSRRYIRIPPSSVIGASLST